MGRAKKPAVESSSSVNTRRASASPAPEQDDIPKGPLSVLISGDTRDEVKVNNANPIELKNACDDALKRYLAHPDLFKQIHHHTDIRLALGWASVFVAAGTALYGYKIEFEQSKPVVWAGLAIYCVLTALQTLYAYFVEGQVVFVGKRKTIAKRISTERITISTNTKAVSSTPTSTSSTTTPSYSLSTTYIRSTSNGKSLLAKGKTQDFAPYSNFFDESGVMQLDAFEAWVGACVERTMEGKSS